MFQRPMVTFLDERTDYGEERWIGVGMLKTHVAVIVFTGRDADTIRIISAQKATRNEEKIYHNEV